MKISALRFESEGGRIIKMEEEVDSKRIDYLGELQGETVMIEVKHGYETVLFEVLPKQADDYLAIAKSRGWILTYHFYNEL